MQTNVRSCRDGFPAPMRCLYAQSAADLPLATAGTARSGRRYPASMSELHQSRGGVWSSGLNPGRADLLLAALPDDGPFVMLTCGNPKLGWHIAPVSIDDEPPSPRRVRGLSFELLVSTKEAREIGPLVRSSHDGSLDCYVLTREPPESFRPTVQSLQHASFWAAMGLSLAVRLPHEGEVAWVAAAREQPLHAFIRNWNALDHSR